LYARGDVIVLFETLDAVDDGEGQGGKSIRRQCDDRDFVMIDGAVAKNEYEHKPCNRHVDDQQATTAYQHRLNLGF